MCARVPRRVSTPSSSTSRRWRVRRRHFENADQGTSSLDAVCISILRFLRDHIARYESLPCKSHRLFHRGEIDIPSFQSNFKISIVMIFRQKYNLTLTAFADK